MSTIRQLKAWKDYCQAQYNRTKDQYWQQQFEAVSKQLLTYN